jgi:hypothetical protein
MPPRDDAPCVQKSGISLSLSLTCRYLSHLASIYLQGFLTSSFDSYLSSYEYEKRLFQDTKQENYRNRVCRRVFLPGRVHHGHDDDGDDALSWSIPHATCVFFYSISIIIIIIIIKTDGLDFVVVVVVVSSISIRKNTETINKTTLFSTSFGDVSFYPRETSPSRSSDSNSADDETLLGHCHSLSIIVLFIIIIIIISTVLLHCYHHHHRYE